MKQSFTIRTFKYEKNAIIGSGCSQVGDSAAHATILRILALEQQNLASEGLALSGLQTAVYDHYTNTVENISPCSEVGNKIACFKGKFIKCTVGT